MLVSKGQRGGRGANIDVLAQNVLTHELEPLHAIPVGGDEQVLRHEGLFVIIGLIGLGQLVGVDEVQEIPEHVCPHVIDLHPAVALGLLHGAE